MPLYSPSRNMIPDAWRVWGHSWFAYTVGPSSDQTGRVDGLLRSRLDIEFMNWRNYSGNGARAITSGGTTSGTSFNGGSWTRMYRFFQPTRTTGPYAPDGGANLLCYGINDLGMLNGSTALTKSGIIESMRAMISRCRSSKVWVNAASMPSGLAAGAGFSSTALTDEFATGGTLRQATTTTNATLTFTLPADYVGEPVVWSFLGRVAAQGGVLTFTGTALTGNPANNSTLDLSGKIDAAWFSHIPVVKRITGLSSANAGQTIIATVTSVGGTTPVVYFDSVWLESTSPPPVIVMNIARIPDAQLTTLTTAGQVYQSWTGTNASRDADVVAVNASLASLVDEFDGMVRIADVDAFIGKEAGKTSDGIHPNEVGGGEIVDAVVTALNSMVRPASASSEALSFHPPAARTGTQRRPRRVGFAYAPDFATYSTLALAASGTAYWVPFQVTESRDQYSQFQVVTTAATVAGTIRCGIYDDPEFAGYPQTLPNLTDYGNLVMTTGAGVKALTPTFPWSPDPGLYWLCFVVVTAGTNTMQSNTGQSPFMPNRPAAGTGTALYAGYSTTGVSTTALPQKAPTNLTLATAVPIIQMLKSK